MLRNTLIGLAVIFGLNLAVTAAVPQLINYQGALNDASGDPVADASYTIVFTIYDADVGGDSKWTETRNVSTVNGQFLVLLGSVNPIEDIVFNEDLRYLGVKVGDDPEMTPRSRLVTNPWAFRVSTVDGASGGNITTQVSIGTGHTNTGGDGFVVGDANTVTGSVSSVTGGANNLVSGEFSIIGSGENNVATGDNTVVGGGVENEASGYGAVVAGGETNTSAGSLATVSGGVDNNATGVFSVVGGGLVNLAADSAATVGGGRNNYARGKYAVIGGGGGATDADSNSANGVWGTIGGGAANIAEGQYCTVAGGYDNRASGRHSTVAGGHNNKAGNPQSGDYQCTIGGGEDNTALFRLATVAGGYNNLAGWSFSTVGGGHSNQATGDASTVAGGTGNIASAWGAAIAGGEANIAADTGATVPGGFRNEANGVFSFASGRRAIADHAGTFVWSDTTDSDFISTAEDQFLIRAQGGVGIGTNSPTRPLEVNGMIYSSSGGFRFPDGSVQTSSATGGPIDDGDWSWNGGNLCVSGSPSVGIGTCFPNYKLDVRGTIGNNVTLYHSDRRWKKEIQPLTGALDKVNRLRGVSFKWRRDEFAEMNFSEGKRLGLIAQEVEEVVPELVDTNAEGYKSVEYANLVALLIEAVKEQQSTITELQSRLERLEQISTQSAAAVGNSTGGSSGR